MDLIEEIKIKVLSSHEVIVAVFEIRNLKKERQTDDREITLNDLGWFVPDAYLVNVQDGFYLLDRDKKNWKLFKIAYQDIIGLPVKNKGWGNSSLVFNTEKLGEITINFDNYIFDSACSIIEKHYKNPYEGNRTLDKSNNISDISNENKNSDPEISANYSHPLTKKTNEEREIITDCPETIKKIRDTVTNKEDIILAVLTVSDLELEKRTSGKKIIFNNPILWQKSYLILVLGGIYFLHEDQNGWKKYKIQFEDIIGPLLEESETLRSHAKFYTSDCGKISFNMGIDLFDKISDILMNQGAITTYDNTERIIKAFPGKFFAGSDSYLWFIITENKIAVTNNFYFYKKTCCTGTTLTGEFSKEFDEISSQYAFGDTFLQENTELIIKKLDIIIEKDNIDKICLITNCVQNYTLLLELKRIKEYRITFTCDYEVYDNIRRNLQEFYPNLMIINSIKKIDSSQIIFNGSSYNEQLLSDLKTVTIGQDEKIRAILEIKYTEKPPEVYRVPVSLKYKRRLLDLDHFFVTNKRIIAILLNGSSNGVYSIPLFDIKSVVINPETFNLSFRCKNAKKFTIAMEGIHNLTYPIKNLFETKSVRFHTC